MRITSSSPASLLALLAFSAASAICALSGGASAMDLSFGRSVPISLSADSVSEWLGVDTRSASVQQLRNAAASRIREWSEEFLAHPLAVARQRLGFFAEDVIRAAQSGSGSGSGSGGDGVEAAAVRKAVDAALSRPALSGRSRQRYAYMGSASDEQVDRTHPVGTQEYPFFRFLPPTVGMLLQGASSPLQWSAPCFASSSAWISGVQGNVVSLQLSVSQPHDWLCSDTYLLATPQGLWPLTVFVEGTHSLNWTLPAQMTDAERWDWQTNGIRLFRFLDGPTQTIADLLDTVLLFVPSNMESRVDPDSAARNLDFLRNYAGVVMSNRTAGTLDIDESLIQSGDFFGVIRLDGLDPMLGWAMGSTTGHTTVALRIDGELFICESTVNDSYWPVNGVQKTPYKLWVQQAVNASYNVVWSPLSADQRAKFNATAAAQWFSTVEGLDYGYRNLLFGWLDTQYDNYPCLPPDFKNCLEWNHIAVLFPLLDTAAPSLTTLFVRQAFNLRLGTTDLGVLDSLYTASKNGMEPSALPAVVEQDSFIYQTTRWGQPAAGRSMVCCVFVCSLWKAAGLFDDLDREVNCGELTNWDDYVLSIFETNYDARPQVCKDADPTNPTCQIVGDYTLTLNNYNSKAPYKHMAEKCPSLAPTYYKPSDC